MSPANLYVLLRRRRRHFCKSQSVKAGKVNYVTSRCATVGEMDCCDVRHIAFTSLPLPHLFLATRASVHLSVLAVMILWSGVMTAHADMTVPPEPESNPTFTLARYSNKTLNIQTPHTKNTPPILVPASHAIVFRLPRLLACPFLSLSLSLSVSCVQRQ